MTNNMKRFFYTSGSHSSGQPGFLKALGKVQVTLRRHSTSELDANIVNVIPCLRRPYKVSDESKGKKIFHKNGKTNPQVMHTGRLVETYVHSNLLVF